MMSAMGLFGLPFRLYLVLKSSKSFCILAVLALYLNKIAAITTYFKAKIYFEEHHSEHHDHNELQEPILKVRVLSLPGGAPIFLNKYKNTPA